MTPDDFHPQFTVGIEAWGKPVSELFCLTEPSAVDLESLLSSDRPCNIVMLHPLSGKMEAPVVPWMAFPVKEHDPVNINAGQLANSFMRGKNPSAAYTDMLQHIDDSIANGIKDQENQ